MSAATTASAQPFTPGHPCPICGGHERLARGNGRRCYGFLSSDGRYAHCSREEYAGGLEIEPRANTYAHRLDGPCRCGETHGPIKPTAAIDTPSCLLSKIVETYVYSDEKGSPLFEVRRLEPKDFKQARIDPDGTRVCEKGCMKGIRLVPYHLDEIINAVSAGDRVYICEGEKDADAAREALLVATCNPGGAGKWRDDFSGFFRGGDVTIVRHKDSEGHRHADRVADSLQGIAGSIQIVESKKGNDLSDHLAAGHTIEELVAVEADADDDSSQVAPEPLKFRAKIRLTDLGNARRLVEQHGRDLRFCAARKQWLVWDGRRWASDDTDEVVRRAKAAVATIYAEAAGAPEREIRKKIAIWAQASENRNRIFSVIELAKSEAQIAIRSDDLDSDPYMLNVLNGTLDLRTGVLRPHRRSDMITKLAPVEYDPDARSELWDRFLERALLDPDARQFAQRAAGYTLLGQAGSDVLIQIHGPPRTGKGTFQDGLASTLGDYAVTAGLEDLAERRNQGGARPEIVRLQGARLVSIYETSRRFKPSASLVKTLTGSDPVTARDLYAKPVTFVPQFTLWIATNHRPRLPDDDAAIWERVRELPFITVIPEEERDPAVRAELRDPKASGAAILSWAMEGCLAYQSEGLVAPEIVKEATQDYREEMDPLRDFFADCCGFAPDGWVKTSKLMEAYEQWCKENGERQLGGTRFRERLRDHGCEPAPRNVGRGWRGITLISTRTMTA